MAQKLLDKDKNPVIHERTGKEILTCEYMGSVSKEVNMEKRLLKVTGTDETLDRDRDIILVDGWKKHFPSHFWF